MGFCWEGLGFGDNEGLGDELVLEIWIRWKLFYEWRMPGEEVLR